MTPEGKRKLWIIVAIVAGAVLTGVAALALAFFGIASMSLGWLFSALVFGVILLGAVLLARPKRRLWFALGSVVLAAIFGLALWQTMPPNLDRVERVAASIEVSADWNVEEVDARGNIWCFKGCPSVTTYYTVPGDALLEVLVEDGWRRTSDMNTMPRVEKGRWTVIVD